MRGERGQPDSAAQWLPGWSCAQLTWKEAQMLVHRCQLGTCSLVLDEIQSVLADWGQNTRGVLE